MTSSRVWKLLSLLSSLAVFAAGAATKEQQECQADGTCNAVPTKSSSPIPSDGQPYCALYLAESTIPGAGMGIFTVEEKKTGDTIARGEICIPFIDMYW